MTSKRKNKTNLKSFSNYCKITILLNLILVLLSLFYYIGIRISAYGQLLGIFFLITFFFNLGIVVLSDKYLIKRTRGKLGIYAIYITYIYLLFIVFGVLSFISRKGKHLWFIPSIIIFYTFISFSLVLVVVNYKLIKVKEGQFKGYSKKKLVSILRIFMVLSGILFFLFYMLLAWTMFSGGPPLIGIATGLVVDLTSGLLFLIIPAITILITRQFSKRNHPKLKNGLIITGITFTFISSLPFLSIPLTINDANSQFANYFGLEWNKFDVEVQKYFLDTPFVLGQYYFGIPFESGENFNFEADILFAKGSNYELRYDAYYPIKPNLLGNETTIIYIHGGGWSEGDKGQHREFLNYFATQGYYIFDVQYRLLNISLFKELAGFEFDLGQGGDKDVLGMWTIEDMISDIANFTQYLSSNNVYGANLQNVYLFGGSAGAHLATLAAFGYNEGLWNFSPWLNISGVIACFPPNFAEYFFYDLGAFFQYGFIPGNKTPSEDPDIYKKYTPSEHIDFADPPCLLFHGTADQLVPYENSATIQTKLINANENTPSILVKGLFGSHGHTETIPHLTIALYYAERFLYLT